MGYFMAYADIQIPSLLDQLNQRFCAAQPDLGGRAWPASPRWPDPGWHFQEKGRPLAAKHAALIECGQQRRRQRWLTLIEATLQPGENGGDAIVGALVEKHPPRPLPVFFTSHDMQGKPVGKPGAFHHPRRARCLSGNGLPGDFAAHAVPASRRPRSGAPT